MQCVDLGDVRLHLAQSGDLQGAAVVYLNPLGADLRVWDSLLPLMPAGLRHIRFDLRGHGLSDAPDGPYRMGALIRDAERLLDALGVRGAVVVGAGLGGLVAQGLAVKRLDLVRALVLMGTAPRLGIAAQWQARASMVQGQGMGALADHLLPRWFAPRDLGHAAPWRAMLERQSPIGIAACCLAIAGTDFYPVTARLTLPTLVIAGAEDREVPPDLARDIGGLIKGARVELLQGAGHLAAVDAPRALAALLGDFLGAIAHACDPDLCEPGCKGH